MKIAGYTLQPFRLRLTRPLVTAHGRIPERQGCIVTLVDEDGLRAFGESAPLPGFGLESLARASEALDTAVRSLVGRELADLDEALDCAEQATRDAPSARAALDGALHDLAAQRAGLSLAAWLAAPLGRKARAHVAVAALIHAAEPRAAADEAESAVRVGYRALKLKLGATEGDHERVAAVRGACPDPVELRLDANGAWSEARARDALEALAVFAPAFVEQPVAAGDVLALARARAASPVPVAADESVASLASARRLLDAGAADLLVLKPAAVGGLREALRIAALARRAQVPVVVTGFLDTAVGGASALALAAALPDARPAGLDAVLEQDLAPLPPVVAGARAVPFGPGLGTRPFPTKATAAPAGEG